MHCVVSAKYGSKKVGFIPYYIQILTIGLYLQNFALKFIVLHFMNKHFLIALSIRVVLFLTKQLSMSNYIYE